MKKLLLSLACVYGVHCANAQDAQDVKPATPARQLNQELGIFGQTEMNNNDYGSASFAGLQYKRWRNEHLGFRAIVAYGQYSAYGSEIRMISGDTSTTRQRQINIDLPVVGFGLEAQRHFYKRVYLFAAVELKGGYGSGTADTFQYKTIGRTSPISSAPESAGGRDADLLYIGMSASVGARLQWTRLALGLELFPVQMTYTKLDDGHPYSGMSEFNLGNFSQRLSLSWRF